jgi:GxxExxY protein
LRLVALKSVERLLDIHKAQVITYLRLAEVPVGLLINFNVSMLRQGLRRLVAARPATPPQAPPDNG